LSQFERPSPLGLPSPSRPVAHGSSAAAPSRRLSVADQQETARVAFRKFDKDRYLNGIVLFVIKLSSQPVAPRISFTAGYVTQYFQIRIYRR
jgi:hypothetical protein